jgi:endonuclease YncB( thermonuclease family)
LWSWQDLLPANYKEVYKLKRIISLILFALLLSSPLNFSFADDEPITIYYTDDWKLSVPFGKTYDYTNIYVKRVIDGDTIQLETGERVRLIGIDTPEMHESNKLYRDSQRTRQDTATIQELGRRAYEFTKKLVENQRVSLEFDVEKYDKYKRLLAYVYLKKDGMFVNAEIIKQGYASLMTIPPNVKYADLFLKLYQEARLNKRGLWEE